MALFLLLLFQFSYAIAQSTFGNGLRVGAVDSREVDEASGLAASRIYPNVLYTHNDGGDTARIFAIDSQDASLIAIFGISGADHYDWEDIAVGPCIGSNKSCIYIADAGHSTHRKVNMIYMVDEPLSLQDQTLTVKNKLPFTWTENDGQTLMIDNRREIYVASNVNGGKGLLAHLPSSGWNSSTPVQPSGTARINITTHHHDPGAGDISSDGTELIIKARNHVYFWDVKNNDYLGAVVTPPKEFPHHYERLGESLCWDRNGTNYYTMSEGVHASLYKFVRIPSGPSVG